MLTPVLALLALVAAVVAARRHQRAGRAPGRIASLDDDTTMGAEGAVRSVQVGELSMTADALEELWSPMQLERLARTYWRFLTHVTLGLIQVDYGEAQRTVVLVRRPLRLLRFKAPEYAMDAQRGTVRWRIEDGLLVQRRGHNGDGYLQIDVHRLPSDEADPARPARIRVEVAVANFYPSISHRLSRPVYRITQSRIHVLVTYGFLRSLARLDLAESRVGRFTRELTVDDVPDPPLPSPVAEPDPETQP
ncbi:MAG TPA: hypothetical protein VKB25_14375 [Conexibacter sp.]|nr:hypothetical protein [Conexibacter sp.]